MNLIVSLHFLYTNGIFKISVTSSYRSVS